MLFAVGLIFYLYLGWRLTEHWLEWPLLAIPFALVLLFPSNRSNELLLNFAFISMALISYLFLFTLLRDASLLLQLTVSRFSVMFLAVASVMVGILKANFGISVKHIKVPVAGLPAELVGIKIAQISDLHIGPTIGPKFVSRIISKVNGEAPDLIAFTGDIGDAKVEDHLETSELLRNLKSKHGIYYVPGNHEYYWNASAWMKRFQQLGFNVLVNDGREIEINQQKVLIAGVPDPVSGIKINPLKPIETFPDARTKILLSHRPEVVSQGQDWGYDLILAGHTHGGQFFPWTLVAHFAHEFNLGLYKVDKGHIYVSAGTGSWGPLVRLGTTPEVTILELVSSK